MKIPNTMLAAFLAGPEQLIIKKIRTPKPGPEEVLIRVEACAICSSDISLIKKPWPGQPPYGYFIPGHEYSGIVVSCGETVDEVKVGDRVAVEVHYGCGRCDNCRVGNYTACLNWGNKKKGHRANGLTTAGGFSQYVINHISTVYKIPDSLSFEEASLVTNLGCVLYGFETAGGYIVGDYVAIIGEGPLGLIALQVAKTLGAEKVYLIGIDPHRLNVGKELGADRIIYAKDENPLEIIKRDTKGVGVDLSIEASGSIDGLRMSEKISKWMGKILLLGIPEGSIDINFHDLARGNKTIFTVRGEGWRNCKRGISLLRNKRINLKPLVTHMFPLNKINEALKTHIEKIDEAIKVIIKPNY